jgi:hypothetical protein
LQQAETKGRRLGPQLQKERKLRVNEYKVMVSDQMIIDE